MQKVFQSKSKKAIILAICFCFSLSAQAAEPDCHSQPGRVESARQLIAQAKKFQLNAKQYHLNARDSIDSAKKLKGQADKLNALGGAIDKDSPKEFKAGLEAFKDHAKQYRAHLEKLEHDMGFCKASEAEYQRHLKEVTLHTEQFHIPNIRPPHICGELQMTERESSSAANSMRADTIRMAKSEADLASSEAKLKSALDKSKHTTEALGKRNTLQEEERKLAGEFARLKTEYELLEIQRSALLGKPAGPAGSAASKTVSGKIKK